MNYPDWILGFPGGLLIALIAIVHVTVSHFAIGGGAFLVVTEKRAYGKNDAAALAYVRRHSKFFALLTVVFGAVTGVGIWFTIGLVTPEATSALIHAFVWAWAIEWVFFFVEITSAIIYATSWDKLDRKSHMLVGWIYFVAAWLSLAVINGIVTFMLTPGKWLQTHNIWDGLFNPTYWPSLFARTALCVLLAGVFGLVTIGKKDGEARERLVRWSGMWMLAGSILLPAFIYWYFLKLPKFSKTYISERMIYVTHALNGGYACAALIGAMTLVFALWKPRWMRAPVVVVLVVASLGLMGSGEYVREFSRKPWVVNGYMYANDIPLAEVPVLQQDGVAAKANFLLTTDTKSMEYGKNLFTLECGSCHAVDGYRSMRQRVKGWDAAFATQMVAHLPMTKGPMPEFAGNEADREALGKYLASLNPPVDYGTITDANRVAVGAQVFAVHCGNCHTVNGNFRPLRDAFTNSTPDQVEGLLPMLDTMSTNMPHFDAPADQTHALAVYIATEANKPLPNPPANSQPGPPPGVK